MKEKSENNNSVRWEKRKGSLYRTRRQKMGLTVQGLSLTTQSVDDIHGGDSLAAGVFSVSDRVTNDVFQEDLQDSSCFFVDQSGDTLDTPTTRQTTNGWFGDSLDIVTKDLSVTLGTALAQSFSAFASARHDECSCFLVKE